MATTYLHNEQIRLRSFELSDVDTLYSWEQDSTAWASSSTLNPLSRQFIKDYIVDSAQSIITRGELSLLIELKQEARPIGYVQLLAYDSISRRVGLGLYIAPEYRRLGYARGVVRLVEAYAFGRLGVRMIYADILASNDACCRLFEGLGYRHTATLPEWHWADGLYHDLKYYQLWNNQ